ncbi:MAG TPA: molecular chaperone HtpG [Pyrinomonadaceae bacterium]|nr:molecular chaperone HtpG [Pyrinomonadaceae bacterium]
MNGVETFPFQAETSQLLELMIHSLYTNREIFLRELISNASDALDRLRFEALTRPELLDDEQRLEIRLETDRAARTLTIQDNGIGMSREELIANIGTIAKSGTRELRAAYSEGAASETISELIGQFGVGFYSCFMVADRVTLLTRRAGEEKATEWESGGDGEYVIRDAEKAVRGTSVTLHLKPPDAESGLEDFTDKWILARVIKRYSDFVSYPIVYKDQREETDSGDGPKTIVIEDKVLNSMKPIWAKPQADVTEEEYAEFYKHLSHDLEGPLKTIHLKAEGKLEYQALLFIPASAPYNLYYHGFEAGLRLYAKGVMIKERCAELLPRYLRFINGVVDSSELPLNISRQMLQQDQHLTQMRKWLTKKVLDTLQSLYEREPEQFLRFWEQFGRAFKEGVGSDYDNKEKIVSLLHFESSADPTKLTTLKEYVGRMKEEQKEIFYLTGESRQVVENSPHLEAFKDKGYEVLYLIDPVDELVVQSLTSFEDKKLKSVGKGIIEIRGEGEDGLGADELKKKEEESAELLELLQKRLDEHVKHVRLSTRLTTSPVCLVGAEHDYSPQLERLLQKGKGAGPKQRRIMELNPQHPIFTKMQERVKKDKDDPVLADYAELLLGSALLAEGSELHDPVRFNQLVTELMAQSI